MNMKRNKQGGRATKKKGKVSEEKHALNFEDNLNMCKTIMDITFKCCAHCAADSKESRAGRLTAYIT